MLPSTGLFKLIACPYFDGEDGGCHRPYCHYKHAKKDDESEQQKVPQYTATPRVTIPPKLLTIGLPTFGEPSNKKRKLEYTPDKPGINDEKSDRKQKRKQEEVPVYVPSNSLKVSADTVIDFSDCEEELEELAEIVDAELSKGDIDEAELSGQSEDSDNKNDCLIVEVKQEIIDVDIEDARLTNGKLENVCEKIDIEHIKKEIKTEKVESSSRHRRSSSSSSSRHKHSSSKDTKSKSSSDKDSHRKRSSDRDRKERDKKSSSSSSVKHSSSSSKSSSQHKHKSSSSDKSRSKSSSSSSRNHKHKSSSSSTSSKSEKKDTDKKDSSQDSTKLPHLRSPSPALAYESSEEDEDVEQQCKMIFEQFQSKPGDSNAAKVKSPEKRSKKEELLDAILEEKYEEPQLKKRVAHETATSSRSSNVPVIVPRKPNHVQNALQSVYQRQELARKKREEEAAAAEEAVKEAEQKLKEATEALRKAKEKDEVQLTPLIPRSYLKPPPRLIAPVANILALEKAKKKVDELRASAGKNNFTLAQTTSKAGSRVAHKPTGAATVQKAPEVAPPVLEATSTKISYNIRMQYYNLMVKHCLVIYPNIEDAWDRAQTEELTVFKKCNTPVIYKSSALLAINKLRKESIDAGNTCVEKNRTVSHEVILAGKLAQNTSWSVNKKMKLDSHNPSDMFDRLPGEKAYEMVAELCLTEEQLIENSYPRSGNRPGTATIKTTRPNRRPNEHQRYCGRCSKVFDLSMYENEATDQCNYHPKHTGYRRGFADNLHRCCQQPAGTPGCTYGNYHVTDYIDLDNLTGFVTTIDKDESYTPTKKDIYALDCEMCYTTHGVELTRVTVVDINSRTVYDALVKPDNKIIDYNTSYSGITEEMLRNETRTLRDVQAILLSMFHSKTVLIGHSLESDLKALKLIHSVVVDTSILYPHKMGPPMKRALKTLCIENLKRIIQESEAGHDSAEDAEVCIQLVKFYLRNKISS